MIQNVIVGFAGLMGSGKTTAADRLTNHLRFYKFPVTRLAFADEVKYIAKRQFGWDGFKDRKGRRLLQVIGTDAGRAYNPNTWVDRVETKIRQLPTKTIVIIHDIRFLNEVRFVQLHGGVVLNIERPSTRPRFHGLKKALGLVHPSERQDYLPSLRPWIDQTIINNEGTESLASKVVDAFHNNFLYNSSEGLFSRV